MLRRRIFSSAMASVMALSSIAVVANAEEATNALKTPEELEKLLTEVYGDSYRSADIYEYGSRCAERMLDALEHADNVLEMAKVGEATEYECTTAYDMVLAVRAQMIQRTAEELKALIDSCTKIYETDNINNEELGDLIYTPESFQVFEDAYEEAESVLDSSDLRIITDAWIDLTDAKAGLNPYKAVTKSAFTAAIKTMEKALDKEKAYDQWRRGTANHNVDPLWFGWYFSNNGSTVGVTYGEMFDQLKNLLPYIYTKYDEFVEVKTADKTTLDDIRMAYSLAVEVAGQINTWQADETKKARKADVQKLLNEYHGRLVYDFAATDAIAMFQAVAIVAGLDNIELEVRKGLYETEFVAWNDIAAFDGLTTDDILDLDKDALFITEWGGGKLMSATLRFRILPKADGGKDIYFLFNEDGIVTGVADQVPAEGDYKKIAAGVKCDLADYVYVYPEYVDGTFEDITGGDMAFVDDHTNNAWVDADWWSGVYQAFTDYIDNYVPAAEIYKGEVHTLGFDNFTALGDALPLAYEYLAENYAGIHAANIDTIGQIAEGTEKGSAAEWTIVHRALKYALEDRYGGSYCKHTKKDVKELIEKSYDLEEKTSQAAIFADSLEDMVAAREEVREWVKEADADKKYKDNISAYDEIASIDGLEYADQVFHYLEGFYNELLADYNAFKYSYGEIYNYIAEVEEMIDANDLTETEELRALILDTAYYMSIVEEPAYDTAENVELDNAAYTEDRYLLAHNRVYTADSDSYDITITDKAVTVYKSGFHPNLKAAYEALVAAVDKQLNPAVLVGDVNGDGKVFSDDAAAILKKIAAGEAAQLPLWDYNNDGAGNSADAAKILKDVAAGILK